jgi:hypothetical protein
MGLTGSWKAEAVLIFTWLREELISEQKPVIRLQR